jgi:hypothetical protein
VALALPIQDASQRAASKVIFQTRSNPATNGPLPVLACGLLAALPRSSPYGLAGQSSSRGGRRTPASPGSASPGAGPPGTFCRPSCLAKNVSGFAFWEALFWAFQNVTLSWPPTILFGQAGLIILQFAPVSRDSSRASIPRGWPPVPGHAAAVRPSSRTSWRCTAGRCESGS